MSNITNLEYSYVTRADVILRKIFYLKNSYSSCNIWAVFEYMQIND